jgi:hypothetical protein
MATKVLSDRDHDSVARILNLPAPASAAEPATKAYVDSAVEGLAWKDSARVATTANLNLAAPGASIDGITMVANDRVLVKNQTSQPENGTYIWNGAAVPMTRSADMSTADELEQAVIGVEEGTSAGSTFRQTTVNFTLGSGNVVFAAFGTSAPAASESTAGIAEIATQAEVDAGTDDARFMTPAKFAGSSLRLKKYAVLIGDGSATSYTVTHSLNTRDVTVAIYRNSGNYDEVIADVEHTSVNAVTVKFAAAPASNAFRVVVTG